MSRTARATGTVPGGTQTGLPAGFRIELDPATKKLSDSILWGGSPARAMRLSAAGCVALTELADGPVRSRAAGLLARRLTDAGLAHPRPPATSGTLDVTVLIPVRDRAGLLDECLTAVAGQFPVLVVDDGSADQESVARTAARHGATLLRRPDSGGPAAARNTGLAAVRTELVAFLDSDCVPPPGWIGRLAAHLADPLVGAVAPRIVAPAAEAGTGAGSAAGRSSAAARYAAACGSLDLGGREARVVPASRVGYVPTAALLVRRAALDCVAAPGGPFDAALRYGEDVDLVWRLHDAGWRIRYEPAVEVPHCGPASWSGLLGRRFRYGTSAGPLARRHPGRLVPLVLQPWPAVAVGCALARRPAAAAAAAAAGWLTMTRTVRRAGLPADGSAAATRTAIHQTWLGTGRYATQFAAPALAALIAAPGGGEQAGRDLAGRWGRRAAAASLLLGPALDAYRQRRPDLDPVRFVLGRIADDVAYGAGVWAGCLAERTLAPVTPHISWRPLRVTGPGSMERKQSDAQLLV